MWVVSNRTSALTEVQSSSRDGSGLIGRVVKNGITNAVDFVFPPLCIVCENDIALASRWLCQRCIAELYRNNSARGACKQCGQNPSLRPCNCLNSPFSHPYESITSLFDFADQVKILVHQIKYNGRSSIARELGRLAPSLLPTDYFNGVDALIPVPLHFLRRWSRGYNQSTALSCGILESIKCPPVLLEEVLIRSRYTKTQTAINRQGRLKNVTNAFALRAGKESMIKDKSIVLVDDVVTTGATSQACAQALQRGGCKRIRILSLARD